MTCCVRGSNENMKLYAIYYILLLLIIVCEFFCAFTIREMNCNLMWAFTLLSFELKIRWGKKVKALFCFGTLASFYVEPCSIMMTVMWHSKHSCIFSVDDHDYSTVHSVYTLLLYQLVICFNLSSLISLFHYLPSDGSDLDTVSHGSLDSANDSAERTSIDNDFTKMDSSDDGFSTGRKLQHCFILFILTSLPDSLVCELPSCVSFPL